jgi:hypothetical protein
MSKQAFRAIGLSCSCVRLGPSILRRSWACAAGCAAIVAAASSSAFAYLGSFTPNDGYQIIQPWVDVSYFNSGQYGINAGGGSANYVVPDSGLWKVSPNYAGGIYANWAARQAALTSVTGNVYPATPPPAGNQAAYIVGNHGPGRTDNSALAFRNDNPAGGGAARYDYTIDSYDYGGITPNTVTSGSVKATVYMLASPAAAAIPGSRASDKFTMSMTDSSGAIGMQWGYAVDNQVCWRPGSSGPWNYAASYVSSSLWDGVSVNIDLTADTFQLLYYTASTNTWSTLAGTTPLGVPMNDLTHIGWQLEDALPFGSFATKNFFDDFSFNVPAPGTGLLGLLALPLLRRKRP